MQKPQIMKWDGRYEIMLSLKSESELLAYLSRIICSQDELIEKAEYCRPSPISKKKSSKNVFTTCNL